jgi:hypothetical protein
MAAVVGSPDKIRTEIVKRTEKVGDRKKVKSGMN